MSFKIEYLCPSGNWLSYASGMTETGAMQNAMVYRKRRSLPVRVIDADGYVVAMF